MEFNTTTLGRTGLKVGRLGIAGGYKAPAEAIEEAFERGCNYFYYGAARREGMQEAIKNICGSGKRDDLVVAVQSFSRSAIYLEISIKKVLKKLNLDHADVLLLGAWNKKPPSRIIDRALALKEKGLFNFLGISSHTRTLFPKLIPDQIFDVFHIRYNAAHRGAEEEIFPFLPDENRPGMAVFTATSWRKLLNSKKIPKGHEPLSASDCYRFVLSNPSVDICHTGPKNIEQVREALTALEKGPMSDEEMDRARTIGDFVSGK